MSFTRARAEGDTELRPGVLTANHPAPRKNSANAAETMRRQEMKTRPFYPKMVDKNRMGVYRWKIILGLFGPFALQALDTTIIASALPFIAAEFGKVQFSSGRN